jgi:hypothetical protein
MDISTVCDLMLETLNTKMDLGTKSHSNVRRVLCLASATEIGWGTHWVYAHFLLVAILEQVW